MARHRVHRGKHGLRAGSTSRPLGCLNGWFLAMVLTACGFSASAETLFPVAPDPGGRFLIDREGKPFLLIGDAAWSLFTGLTLAEAEQYLAVRQQQGFNAVLVNVLDDSYLTLRNGTRPFADGQAFRRPNERYFGHVESVVRSAQSKGMLVLLVPAYLGCCGPEIGWKRLLGAASLKDVRAYGEYVGKRFGRFRNVLWVMGGDRDPDTGFDGHPRGLRLQIDALADSIKQVCPHCVFTAHTGHNNSARQQYPESIWLGVNSIYTYYPEKNGDPHVYEWAYVEHARKPTLPYFLIEAGYEEVDPSGQSRWIARRQAYWALLGGATGSVYGHALTWGASRDWRQGLHAPGASDVTRMASFFHSIPWHRLRPDLDGRLVRTGQSAFGSAEWIAAGIADDGRTAVAYVPRSMLPLRKKNRLAAFADGSFVDAFRGSTRRTIVVDLGVLRQPVMAEWYLPASGTTRRENGGRVLSNTTKTASFTVPCADDDAYCDAVLVLKSGR